MSETIADRIEKFRKQTKGGPESSRALARRAGISIQTLSIILKGNEPKDRTLQTIAEHLGCTAVYLRYGVGETPGLNIQPAKGEESCQAI